MKQCKNLAIVQARMGSTRLPLKMMLSLHGKPVIEWVLSRAARAKRLDAIVVAIPDTKRDDVLARYVKRLGFDVFRGSEANVLERFYYAAATYEPKNVIRICADNPLVCPEAIDDLVDFFEKNTLDYAYNHIPKNNSYPDGLGAEITTFTNLEHMYKVVTQARHKEHCMSYITDNTQRFAIATFDPAEEALHKPHLRFDIDTFEDYAYLSSKDFSIDIKATELVKLFEG